MSEFIQYVLYELNSILILLALAGVLAAGVIACAYLIFRKRHKGEKKFPWGRVALYLLLAGYLFILVSATLLRRTGGFRREYNLHFLRAWLEAWNNFSVKNWANVLLNVALFVPLGALLPLLWKKCRKWYVTVPIGVAASLAIELVQLAISRGICDVDDLFANSLGAAMGFFLIMAILSLKNEKGAKLKPCLLNSAAALLPVLAICGIFACYHLQEYGNLPNAPTHTNNTKGVSWSLECQLPAAEDRASAYKTQTRSKAQCDQFAKEMAQNMGLTVDMTSYYQDFAYYHLRPSGVLMVYYFDGSYEFMSGAHWEKTNWTQADRQTVEKALEAYPVDIPEQAVFSYEGDGWHSFTAYRQTDGALMYDGTLRARYADSGKVEVVENRLCAYSYYEEVKIISPQQALSQLKAGRFNDEGYFEYVRPKAVAVTACELTYQVDTKGFYQPVYIFSLKSPDGAYADRVMIPAKK
ncbi:MAG: VanZ family protein [Oscillospiraceae bacterium]|nr:VanZ family protein [Oscillospiraceae bacterium]